MIDLITDFEYIAFQNCGAADLAYSKFGNQIFKKN